MAELLIRVRDKVNPDSIYLDCKCLKAGDVVSVCPDGWTWGIEDRRNPDWRIFAIPGMTVSEAEAFVTPEKDTDPLRPSKVLRKRAFHLDLAALKSIAPLATFLNDNTRATAIFTVSGASRLGAVRAAKVAYTPLTDPVLTLAGASVGVL